MIKKQGITVTVLVITVIILTILAGTITVSTYSTINYSRLSAWATEITYIQDVVNEQLNNSSGESYTLGDITINIEGTIQDEQFEGETIAEDNTVTLKILDLGKLKITNTIYGILKTETDVYAVSQETGRVYYVQGIEIEGKIYYSLTESLKQRFNLSTAANNLSSIVFVPSAMGYSNKPITVIVKVPNTYTDIAISTSNDEIQIGSQTVKETTYEYAINVNQIAGNYLVTVSYNDGTQTLTSKYNVNGYDVTAPIIVPIAYENLVYKETDTDIIDYITNVTATDASGIKTIKYTLGTVSEENAETYFKENGNVIINGRINLDRITTVYTIYAEDNAGNFSIHTFDKKEIIPNTWEENVVAIVDTVPIPKGFVASPYEGENTKDGGLVIYELAENETAIPSTETQFTSLTTRNQYVWVPASDTSTNKFERKSWDSYTIISDRLGIQSWEATSNENLMATYDNTDYQWCMDKEYQIADTCKKYYGNPTIKAGDFVTQKTIDEVTEMYESIEKYGGFYIARYEAGLDLDAHRTQNDGEVEATVYSQMNKAPYNYVGWSNSNTMTVETGGAVQVAREMYPKINQNYGVVSTLTYGVQWDTVMRWLQDKGLNILDSTNYGNYESNEIPNSTFNTGASVSKDDGVTYTTITSDYSKANNQSHLLTTGATTEARVCNIYDIAGNLYEWTMEGTHASFRNTRGGGYQDEPGGYVSPVSGRNGYAPYKGDFLDGFRPTLYIKLPT